jgi:hypothetical protein
VRSSYGNIARGLAKIQPAVPTCPPGSQLQIRVDTRTDIWLDTDRDFHPTALHSIERDYRCRPARQSNRRSP